jgi:ribosomal protein S25
MPDLGLPPLEGRTIVDDYCDWAQEATDAIPQFHELCAFILLSALCSSSIRLGTSYGPVTPNLWGLILGDSTLTRKTTAMQLATGFIADLDRDIVLATDGSVEGLLTGLATRPNKVSIFLRDEVTGFFDSINRKDYLAGMPETFTALYDVPPFFTRRLRKETINIENPVFIFFGGGIKDKVHQVVTEEYILSGFLPRFLIVSGETDMGRIRRTGPLEPQAVEKRTALLKQFAKLYEMYGSEVQMTIGGQPMMVAQRIEGYFTSEAWQLYGDLEQQLVSKASESPYSMLALPTFERLSRSMMKMALLIAAARQPPVENTIQADYPDVLRAAHYIQKWGTHSAELILHAGKGLTEKIIDRILRAINKYPGILRSTLMQHYHLTKREADEILNTLEERGQIRTQRQGRGYAYWAI